MVQCEFLALQVPTTGGGERQKRNNVYLVDANCNLGSLTFLCQFQATHLFIFGVVNLFCIRAHTSKFLLSLS
jgi:hypothetical protein